MLDTVVQEGTSQKQERKEDQEERGLICDRKRAIRLQTNEAGCDRCELRVWFRHKAEERWSGVEWVKTC